MQNRKKTALTAWLLITAVFLLLLWYLWFETEGLTIQVEPNDTLTTFSVIVTNTSGHRITQIQVKQQTGETLETIARLDPQEQYEIQIPIQEERITITAQAPFHKTVEASAFLSTPRAFQLSIETPETLRIQEPFTLSLRICNQTTENTVTITEQHDPSFFSGASQEQTLTIPTRTCANTTFSFTPLLSGATLVHFNIQTRSVSETHETEMIIGT